jgi:hypothetical protein
MIVEQNSAYMLTYAYVDKYLYICAIITKFLNFINKFLRTHYNSVYRKINDMIYNII